MNNIELDPRIAKLADELQAVINNHPDLHVMIVIGKEEKATFFVFTNSCTACMLDLVHNFEEDVQPMHNNHIEDEVIH